MTSGIIADFFRFHVEAVRANNRVAHCSPVRRQPGPAFMDTRYFDMTLDDGRVYRVRVSDITPEDATPTRVKETT